MTEKFTCVGLIAVVGAIMYGLMLVLKFVADTFPIISVLLLPVYLYLFFREFQMILKRRAFANDPFDTDYHLIGYGRFSGIKIALFSLGFLITFTGLINVSEIATMFLMAVAIPIGMYRMLEIGTDIGGDVFAHSYED